MSSQSLHLTMQTYTPIHLATKPSKDRLLEEFRGKSLHAVRTPAMVIDKAIFANNCGKMHARAKEWGAAFRAHLKTHKVMQSL